MKNWVNMQINTEISLKSLNVLYIVIKQKVGDGRTLVWSKLSDQLQTRIDLNKMFPSFPGVVLKFTSRENMLQNN